YRQVSEGQLSERKQTERIEPIFDRRHKNGEWRYTKYKVHEREMKRK
ncbi:hypothetical protein KIPB_012793, partial [Kipferlia bialata]